MKKTKLLKLFLMNILFFLRRYYRNILGIAFLIFLLYYFIDIIKPQYELNKERINNLLSLAEKQSFCSKRSAQRGFNQSVLSVSAYESDDRIELKTSQTWSYIQTFVTEAKKLYPTWTVRVYHYNLKDKTKNDIENLEKLHDNLDFCDVENLPVLGNVRNKLPGKVQRFLAAVDPLVGTVMIRDLDSEIFEREVEAVNEWLSETTYAFHVMRDHHMHDIPMLGGLWGVALNRLSIDNRFTIAHALLPSDNEADIRQFLKSYSRTGDQLFLTDHIWPLARQSALAHDSYSCFWSRYIYRIDTRPFLSKRRQPSCFVGCPKPCCPSEMGKNEDWSSSKQCPYMCRPKHHKDWLFC